MLKYLLGPVLMGTGYLAGSIYGRDAEQLVHKTPTESYAAVEAALDNVRPSGATFFDGGTPMPYELKVDRTLDRQLLVALSFNASSVCACSRSFWLTQACSWAGLSRGVLAGVAAVGLAAGLSAACDDGSAAMPTTNTRGKRMW